MSNISNQVHINLDQILDIVGLGTRRASSFMALGLLVSADEAITSISLDSNFQIQFMPPNLDRGQIRATQRDFRIWIIGNGLRELDQTTSIFCDRIYEARTLVQFNNRGLMQEAMDRIVRFKNRTNVAEKLRIIAEEFVIDTDFRPYMVGLSKARNALSHNMGVVAERSATHEGELRLSWVALEFVVGDHIIAGEFEPFRVEKDEEMVVRTIRRDRVIRIGESIELSPHDLHEICLTYWQQAQGLIKELERQLRELGIIDPASITGGNPP